MRRAPRPGKTRKPGPRQARTTRPRTTRKTRSAQKTAQATDVASIEIHEIESIRHELERVARGPAPRWNADPEDVRRSVAKLVLTLVEFIRELLERQAIRRMDAGTLTAEQTEAVGLALMRLEETVRDIGAQFGLTADDLNLDLGPVGRLM
jgi:hypothetical protein